jgi:hypothetical protein
MLYVKYRPIFKTMKRNSSPISCACHAAAKPSDGLAGHRLFLRTHWRRLFCRMPDARPELPAFSRCSRKPVFRFMAVAGNERLFSYGCTAFAWSLKKQSLAPKKVYVIDNGIILTGSLPFTDNEGALLENFVYTVLRAQTRDVFYFAGSVKECDFVVNPYGNRPLKAILFWNRRKRSGLFRPGNLRGRPQRTGRNRL